MMFLNNSKRSVFFRTPCIQIFSQRSKAINDTTIFFSKITSDLKGKYRNNLKKEGRLF